MKDDAEGVAMAAFERAHAMAHLRTRIAALARHGAVAHGEEHGVALLRSEHQRSRLHARPLLRQHQLAAFEVVPRL